MRGPATIECDACALGKMQRQISRREPERQGHQKVLQEIHVDWTALPPDTKEFKRVLFLTDVATNYVFLYFCKSSESAESAKHIKSFVVMLHNMYFRPLVFRSDKEFSTKSLVKWLAKRGITVEVSAPNTPAQNGRAERSGGW